MIRVTHVVGARPNFMKAAAVVRALESAADVEQILVHTGQHYDARMSDVFFRQLQLRPPDVNLEVGSGSHAVQTADVMVKLEAHLLETRPDLLMVYGDVNSTVAAALVAAKAGVRIAHVEAGLRSFDRSMPEEINRIVTDGLSDLFFTHSPEADENLIREGARSAAIHRVGNVMIDTLVRSLPLTNAKQTLTDLGVCPDAPFALVTLHRPSSVDDENLLKSLVGTLANLSVRIPVIFPVHPRTRLRIQPQWIDTGCITLTEPLGYLEFLGLEQAARLVITDSGGVQEETTYLGVPCITVRDNTERPITISAGTNVLVGRDPERMLAESIRILETPASPSKPVPEFWDGRAGERIAGVVRSVLATSAQLDTRCDSKGER